MSNEILHPPHNLEEILEAQEKLIDLLFESNAIKFGEFNNLKMHRKNPNMPSSPIYVSVREKDVLDGTFPQLCQTVVDLMILKLGIKKNDHCLGVPNGGIPFAELFSQITGINLLKMEKQNTPDDKGQISPNVIGEYEQQQTVLLIEDVVTQGNSLFEVINGLKICKLKVTRVFSVIDREQGGGTRIQKENIVFDPLLKLSCLLKKGLENGKIGEEDYRKTLSYLNIYNNQFI